MREGSPTRNERVNLFRLVFPCVFRPIVCLFTSHSRSSSGYLLLHLGVTVSFVFLDSHLVPCFRRVIRHRYDQGRERGVYLSFTTGFSPFICTSVTLYLADRNASFRRVFCSVAYSSIADPCCKANTPRNASRRQEIWGGSTRVIGLEARQQKISKVTPPPYIALVAGRHFLRFIFSACRLLRSFVLVSLLHSL